MVHGRCSPAYGMADGSSASGSVLLLSSPLSWPNSASASVVLCPPLLCRLCLSPSRDAVEGELEQRPQRTGTGSDVGQRKDAVGAGHEGDRGRPPTADKAGGGLPVRGRQEGEAQNGRGRGKRGAKEREVYWRAAVFLGKPFLLGKT